MAAEETPVDTQGVRPELDDRERRVLGVLVEKAKTTPDIYPLSVNAMVTGSNQKSNRDPVVNFSEDDVSDTLESLEKKKLVSRVQGGRVERWRHHLYELWNVNKVELAVLAELLLRGAQTEGELRTRASRMEPIADLDALRAVLAAMKERGLIVFLGPEGRRGTTLTHGFHSPRELEMLRSSPQPPLESRLQPASPPEGGTPTAPQRVHPDAVAEIRAEVAALRAEMANMQQALTALGEQVRSRTARGGSSDTPPA
jgi:uncharacterized protein YceH (UPF0502 family)